MKKFTKGIATIAISMVSVSAALGQFSDGGTDDVYTMGKVGIGTSSNAYGKLQISGDGSTEGLCIYKDASSGGTFRMYIQNEIGYLTRSGSNAKGLAITKEGNVGIGTSSPSRKLTIGGSTRPYMSFMPTSTNKEFVVGSDDRGFIIFDNNVKAYRFEISKSGNVGIGRTPQYKLDVNGNARTTELVATTRVVTPFIEGWGRDFHFIYQPNDGFTYKSRAIGNYSLGWYDLADDGNNEDGDESLAPTGVLSGWNGLKFFTGAKERMYISQAGDVRTTGNLETGGNIVTGTGANISVNHNVTAPWSYAMVINVKNNQTKAFNIYNNGAATFQIAGNGNVLAKKIYAEHIEVRSDAGTQWYDHVFNEDYDLMPLTEVEEFIQENKHLPTIPSQEDVNRDGVNLVEMDGLLLKKVEELTLYMIEQSKTIEAQQQKIEQLEAIINK